MAGETTKKAAVRRSAKKPSKVAKRAATRRAATKPTLRAGGNPQIEKADGDAPVQAYIAAMPGWKRDVGRRLDALIVRTSPGVRKAVKWNSPFYGIEGRVLVAPPEIRTGDLAILEAHAGASAP